MLFTLTLSTVLLVISAAALPPSTGQGVEYIKVIPITKRSSLVKDDNSVDFDALGRHTSQVKAKILRGLDNFEKNTGTVHPLSVKSLVGRGYAADQLTDYNNTLWYGDISIGTPPVSFTVDFDTGSSDLFVPASTCDDSCRGHTLWNPASSSTAQDLDKSITLKFGDSSTATVEEYSDTVAIGDLTATSQTLGAVVDYSDGFEIAYFPPDGLLGMGFQSISVYGTSPFFQTLVSEGQVDNSVFSFKLSSSGSELYLGGSNSELYTGEFSYAPVTVQGFWQVNMDSIEGNGDTYFTNVKAIIDTGTSVIVGPQSDVEALHAALGGQDAGNGTYTFPCDSFPSISLAFGGTSFPISASALNLGSNPDDSSTCFSGIIGVDLGLGTSVWIVGDVFLLNVYTMFDVGNARVGFASPADS